MVYYYSLDTINQRPGTMAISSLGLQTHIWNNNLKSILLLIGFPILWLLMIFAFFAFAGGTGNSKNPMDAGIEGVQNFGFVAFMITAVWFFVAFLFHQTMINLATGAKSLERSENPEIYNMLENLCISRGMAMPKLYIIETDALNAYASGITDRSYAVTLTRGIVEKLNKEELEAVIAHELSHIRHKDVRLLIVSVIFVGMISFFAEMAFRSMTRRSMGGGGRNAGAQMLIAAVILGIGYFFATLIRFALSRKREYLADAGAVELTKNPTALISALRKISGNDQIEGAPAEVKQMFIENSASFAGLFATHPPMDKRIEALVMLGGENTVLADDNEFSGPWAEPDNTPSSTTRGPWS